MYDKKTIAARLKKPDRDYLKRYFADAPQSVLGRIQLLEMEAGTVFIEEGSPADQIYIFISGSVMAVDYRVREIVYDFFGFRPVEVFGGMEVLGAMDKYKCTLITTEKCIFLRMSRNSYENWIMNDLNALRMESEKTVNYLLEQARSERLYMLLSGYERTCLSLLNLYNIHKAEGGMCSIKMSRNDLAQMTGISERTITRALQTMEKEGLISRNGRNIIITAKQYGKMKNLIDTVISQMG